MRTVINLVLHTFYIEKTCVTENVGIQYNRYYDLPFTDGKMVFTHDICMRGTVVMTLRMRAFVINGICLGAVLI